MKMEFCLRDDDTSFFTSPDDLERAYGEISRWGPVSLAVVPFHRAGISKAVPEKFRRGWSVHPLHENPALVDYVRRGISDGRFEIMLHGYHHDERNGRPEFVCGKDLVQKVFEGRRYLEDLLGTSIRVFVPPHNAIGREGLRAIARAKLHLGCVAGVRSGWPLLSPATWKNWLKLRRWQRSGGVGIPWVLNFGDHREIAGTPVTPVSTVEHNKKAFDAALKLGGVFCAATHYWELGVPSCRVGQPSVGEHLKELTELARCDNRVVWRSVGDIVSDGPCSVSRHK
jgi:hypothetical protein